MTVESTARKQSFAGGQQTLTFSFRALVDSPQDIKVVTVSSSTETLLTYTTQYTVAVASDGIGGVVTVNPSFSTAYTYTVYRDTTNKQESDYDDYNQFPADTLEEDLDRRTLVDQEQSEDLDRAIRVPISSSLGGLELPTPVASSVIGWNAAADGLTNYDNAAASVASAATYSVLAGLYAATASTQASLVALYASTASTQAALSSLYATTASTAAATIPSPGSGNIADQMRVNAAKTAFELFAPTSSSASFKVGSFSRDMVATSSTQVITGVGFQPKSIVILANQNVTAKTSIGFSDGTTQGVIHDYQGETANTWGNGTVSIFAVQSLSQYQSGSITTFGADGFSVVWTRTGTPTTGTLTCHYLAIR